MDLDERREGCKNQRHVGHLNDMRLSRPLQHSTNSIPLLSGCSVAIEKGVGAMVALPRWLLLLAYYLKRLQLPFGKQKLCTFLQEYCSSLRFCSTIQEAHRQTLLRVTTRLTPPYLCGKIY
jgi:hypothetical protein